VLPLLSVRSVLSRLAGRVTTRKKRVSVVLSDPLLSLVEDAAKKAGVSVSAVTAGVLERMLVRETTLEVQDDVQDYGEAVDMLLTSMHSLRDLAAEELREGKHLESMSDYLKAASMGVEAMASMNRVGQESEAKLMDVLLEVMDLMRRGTGYSRLPDSKFMRVNLSTS
jgi:hypothetical protein